MPGDDRAARPRSTPVRLRLDEHAREARIDRQARDLAAEVGERGASSPLARRSTPAGRTAPSSSEQVERRLHAARVGRGEERERRDVAEARATSICRMTEARLVRRISGSVNSSRVREVVFARTAGSRCPGAVRPARPDALLRRGLRDRLDRQPLDLAAVAVARDARGAGVDDVPDAGHGQARLGDVGREDDAATHAGDRRALEDAVLLGRAQAAVEGEDLGGSGILRVHPAHGVRRVADLGLAGQEDEHVARRLAVELAQRRDDAVDVVAAVGAACAAIRRRPRCLVDGPVADLDRVGAPRDLDDRRGVCRRHPRSASRSSRDRSSRW